MGWSKRWSLAIFWQMMAILMLHSVLQRSPAVPIVETPKR